MPRPLCLGLVIASLVGITNSTSFTRSLRAATTPQVLPVPDACVPFEPPVLDRPIDNASTGCGLPGNEPEDTPLSQAHGAQNRTKNNFCAWQSTTPARVTRLSFDKLDAQMPHVTCCGADTLPSVAERHVLQTPFYTTTEGAKLGEGSYVELVAYILEGRLGGIESVNCGRTKRGDIDIHLALVTTAPTLLNLNAAGATECTSITAELSPHHRPIEWDVLGRMTGTPTGQRLTKAHTKLKDENLQRPLRFRGQLFFDASHNLCANGQPTAGNPARRSHWEIHPVYSIDACKFTTIANCPSDGAVWTPLEDFLAGGSDEGRP
jgi:hypothetical protein